MSPPEAGSVAAATAVLWAAGAAFVAANVAVYDDGPEALFCSYTCAPGQSSRPGSCYPAERVYDTGGIGWLTLRTRDETMLPGDRTVLPEWTNVSGGNMTWEGWFRVTEPPEQPTTLFGTYGANHDNQGFTYIVSDSRRRFAAVFLNKQGEVELTTNAGRSSGSSSGAHTVADGRWHHLAATFSDGGGARINVTFRIKWLNLVTIMGKVFLREPALLSLQEAVARTAGGGTQPGDVFIELQDALFKPSSIEWEYALRAYCLINTPLETVEAKMTELRAATRLAKEVASAMRSVPLIELAVSPDFFVEDIEADPEDITLPEMLPAGSARLWVDGYRPSDSVTYDRIGSPDGAEFEDNIGMDGQLVVGGGQLGRGIRAQVGRFRLWSIALEQSQIREVLQCELPDLRELVGGDAPYGLVGSYTLNGNLRNTGNETVSLYADNMSAIDPLFMYSIDMEDDVAQPIGSASPASGGGQFVKGGVCHHAQCPSSQERPGLGRGCPLGREVKFETKDSCEEFASWNFCRKAGPGRGRPAMPDLQGCHAGGTIRGPGGPLGWRVNRTTS